MDEILRTPNHVPVRPASRSARRSGREQKDTAWSDRLHRFADAAAARSRRLKLQSARVYHRVHSATAGKPKLGPLSFLALSLVIGLASVVGVVYTPAYVVSVDGVDLGLVQEPQVFEQVMDRVEARASNILGYDYTLQNQVGYERVLAEREDLSPISGFETYLFSQVGEVMKSYVLTVDGQALGAVTDRAQIDQMLDEIAAPYVNADTISVTYDKAVGVSLEYTPSESIKDISEMKAALTANTSGQTTYEVQKGDTFMALAFSNGMTMAEMEALNPGVDINKLQIGQLLNIKEEVPYLSVQTVDSITYTEEIPCTVREVEDDTMYQGESKVLDPGVPGEALVSANVTYVNGHERERDILSSTTVREATEKVVAVGTVPRPSWLPNGYYVWPCYGRITSRFGYRYIFGSYSYHSGIDIAVPYGTSVKAADGGTVTFAGYKGSYGYLVIIDHGNGEQTYYGHNSSLLVSAGDKVYQGQTIAKAGSTGRSTGSHCHFEIRVNGTQVNPSAYLN